MGLGAFGLDWCNTERSFFTVGREEMERAMVQVTVERKLKRTGVRRLAKLLREAAKKAIKERGSSYSDGKFTGRDEVKTTLKSLRKHYLDVQVTDECAFVAGPH